MIHSFNLWKTNKLSWEAMKKNLVYTNYTELYKLLSVNWWLKTSEISSSEILFFFSRRYYSCSDIILLYVASYNNVPNVHVRYNYQQIMKKESLASCWLDLSTMSLQKG